MNCCKILPHGPTKTIHFCHNGIAAEFENFSYTGGISFEKTFKRIRFLPGIICSNTCNFYTYFNARSTCKICLL